MTLVPGLMVATVLTLLFVPALYAAWRRVRRPGETPAVLAGMEIESPSPNLPVSTAPAISAPTAQI